MADPWAQHLGKKVTLIKQSPAKGSSIEAGEYFDSNAPKARQLPGKIIGTNAGGSVVIMLDKPFVRAGYQGSWTNPGNMAGIAMEFRAEVAAAVAKSEDRFITLSTSHAHAFKVHDELASPAGAKNKTSAKASAQKEEAKSFFEMLKEDSQDAAFRVASDKIAEGVRNLITLGLMAQLGGNTTVDAITGVLNTPMGKALVQATAGYALTYAPKKLSGDPRVKRLAKEFRVAGMATAGGVVADTVMDQIAPLIESALEMLPGSGAEKADSKVRVTGESAPQRNNVVPFEQAEEEDSETEKSSSQRMVAGASSR